MGGPCQKYGNPNPPFVYFKSMNVGAWERVPPNAVPPTIRHNLLLHWNRPEVENLREPLKIKQKDVLHINAPKEILEFTPTNQQRQRFC